MQPTFVISCHAERSGLSEGQSHAVEASLPSSHRLEPLCDGSAQRPEDVLIVARSFNAGSMVRSGTREYVMRAKWDRPKDNPTQPKHPYQRPAGSNPLQRQRVTSGGRSDIARRFNAGSMARSGTRAAHPFAGRQPGLPCVFAASGTRRRMTKDQGEFRWHFRSRSCTR